VAAKDGVGRAKTGKVPGKMDEIENSPQNIFPRCVSCDKAQR